MTDERVLEIRVAGLSEKVDDVEERVDKLENRVYKVEDGFSLLMRKNAEDRANMKHFEAKIENIEASLKEIVNELKSLGNKLVENSVRSELNKNNGLFKGISDTNNKALIILIMVLGAGLLFMLGMSVGDILKIIP